ncbi:MAG: low molecular weight phosphatase family protein [Candidatus Paceibacterota bacterium]|jgi:protein-tyrosine-phosphatase
MNKKVLFICKGNWFRSQTAEAIYNQITKSNDAFSVGTYVGAVDEPEGQVLKDLFKQNLSFLNVMKSHGMNLDDKVTKKLLPEMIDQFDIVVSMAEEPFIPDFLKNDKSVIWWQVENPTGFSNDEIYYENAYQKIYKLVSDLISKKGI